MPEENILISLGEREEKEKGRGGKKRERERGWIWVKKWSDLADPVRKASRRDEI